MTKEILLIGDFAGVGKVAFSVMTPILTAPGRTLSFLPTAVVSNSFDYGDAVIQELTPYMANAAAMWKVHQFQFDIVVTGFIFSREQVNIIQDLLTSQDKKPFLISDPIMGDLGELYSSLTPELVEGMRHIMPLADLIIPNLTEALLILGKESEFNTATEEKVLSWIKALTELGAKSVIVTSVELNDDFYIFGYSDTEKVFFKVAYTNIPIHFGGTGDVFTSLITNEILKNPETTLQSKVERAAKKISKILKIEAQRPRDRIDEVYIQNHLEVLKN